MRVTLRSITALPTLHAPLQEVSDHNSAFCVRIKLRGNAQWQGQIHRPEKEASKKWSRSSDARLETLNNSRSPGGIKTAPLKLHPVVHHKITGGDHHTGNQR